MTGIDANRRLAELLGWTEIFDVGGALLGMPPGGNPASRDQARVPDWVGDWNACGPLMMQFVRRMKLWPHRAVVGTSTAGCDLVRDPQRGESDAANFRRLVVDAAIAELEARR
jgi:hypothetical protein